MKRTVRLTESELIHLIKKIVTEQTTISKPLGLGYKTAPSDATQTTNFKGQQTNPVKRSDVENFDYPATPIDDHQLATILSIGTSFIPVVGPFISAGISLYGAKKYYDEGDKRSATINAIFAILPGVSKIVSKIPQVKTLGEGGMKVLAEKISKYGLKAKFSPLENQVLHGVNRNFNLVKGEVNTSFKNIAINAVKSGFKDPVIKKIANAGVNYLKTDIKKTIAGKVYDYALK